MSWAKLTGYVLGFLVVSLVATDGRAEPTLRLEAEQAFNRRLAERIAPAFHLVVDPAQRGLLAIVGKKIVLLPWNEPARDATAYRTRGGDYGQPIGLFSQLDGVAIAQAKLRRTTFYDGNGEVLTALPWQRAGCTDGSVWLRSDRIVCLGSPIVADDDGEPRWDDARWRRAHLRQDCRLFLVDPRAPEAQTPLLCDERLDSPVGRGLPGGRALPSLDGERIYAVLDALPELIVLDKTGKVLRRQPFLEADEVFPQPTQAEVDRQYASADAAIEFRNRFDWPVGLLRWGHAESHETQAIAIVFRRWIETRPVFVADLFSAEGKKLADDLALSDPASPPLQDNPYVSTIAAPDGRSFLLLGDRRSGDRRLLSQRLYEVVLDGLDADGRPLRVSVRDDRGPLPDARVIDVEAREAFLTDGAGIARLIDRPPTPFALEVRADDHIPRELWVQPEERQLDVELDRGSGFRIRLLDPLGAALDAVRVRPYQGGRFHTLERHLDAEGSVEVAGLRTGAVELTFLVDGYRAARLQADLPVAGTTADLGTLVLDPGGVVEGRLITEDGTPLADAATLAHRPSRSGRLGAEYHGDLLTDSTDADGRFRLGGLEPGETCIRIDHAHAPPLALDVTALGEDETRDLGTITIGPAIRVHGRVEDGAEQPLDGESIELRAGSADDPCRRLTTMTDTRGHFAFDAVGVGSWTAVVRRDGQVVARRTLILDDETDDPGDLGTLIVAERRLAGVVRIGGLHAAGGGLSLEPRHTSSAPTPLFVDERGGQRLINDRPIALGAPVDADGSFVLTGVLPAGPVVVTYRTPDGDAFRRVVHLSSGDSEQTSSTRLDLDFDGFELRGLAQLADGQPAAGARLVLHLDDLAVRETAADAAGRFRLTSVPAQGRLVARLGSLVGEASIGLNHRRVDIELRSTVHR